MGVRAIALLYPLAPMHPYVLACMFSLYACFPLACLVVCHHIIMHAAFTRPSSPSWWSSCRQAAHLLMSCSSRCNNMKIAVHVCCVLNDATNINRYATNIDDQKPYSDATNTSAIHRCTNMKIIVWTWSRIV